jgi:PAS domain S-box-containing protein
LQEKIKKYLAIESHEILNELSVGVIICNNLYEVLFINKSFGELSSFYGLVSKDLSEIKNLFDIDFFNDENLKREIALLQKGLPFESEISSTDFNKRGFIKLIVKASPIIDAGNFDGAIFIIEDLRVAIETTTEYIKRNADLQRVIEKSADFFVIVDKESTITQYSITIPSALRDSIADITNPSISEIVHPEDVRIINYYLNYTKLEKKVSYFALRLKNDFDYQCKIIPITNKINEVSYCYIFFDKITSKPSVSRIENDYTAYVENIFNLTKIYYVVYDNDFNLVEKSKNIGEIIFSKKPPEEGKKIYEIVSFIDKNTLELAESSIKRNNVFLTKIAIESDEKKQKFFELKFTPTFDGNKFLLITDITDNELREKKYRNNIISLETTLNLSTQMILLLKVSGEIVFANDLFCDNMRYDKKQIINKSFYSLIDPTYLEKNIFELSAFAKRRSVELDIPVIKASGEKVLLSSYFSPVKTSTGGFNLIAGYFSEIDKLKAKEQELNFYKDIIQNSHDGIALVENSRFVNTNSTFLEIFGYESGDELEGRNFLDLINDDDTIRVSEFMRLVELKKLSPGKIDFVGRKRDNTRINIEMSVGLLDIDSRRILILSARDITEKIKAHREVRESEEKYRTIVDNIDECLFYFERVGFRLKPIFCNPSIKKITGYNPSEFLNDSKFFFRIAYPQDFKTVKPKLLDILKSKSKKHGELDFRIINKDGNIIWVRVKLNLQRSLSGNVQKVFGLISDVTVQKQQEEEIVKTNQQLKLLNETKDKFISIISHDLRTPFTSILGFTDLLQNDETLSDSEKKQYIKFIHESAQSMLSLVNSVLDWTRIQTGRVKFEPEKTNVTEIVTQVVNSLSGAALRKSIKIFNFINKDIYLFVDKNLISQVFFNLISNAIKFTPENGRIEIFAEPNSNHTYYNFSIKDSGIGIKPEDLKKLFTVDAKFSTEGTAGEKGTGLGLSLVKEIIEKHNGKIWVESQYQRGSNFQFSLPISSASIILVENDNAEKMFISKLIKSFKPDFIVHTATLASEALQSIKNLNPALVITDHSLPDMNGVEFVKQVIKLNLSKKLPVIIVGSQIDKALMNDYAELGVEHILIKPINVASLQQAIDKSLIKSFQRTKI